MTSAAGRMMRRTTPFLRPMCVMRDLPARLARFAALPVLFALLALPAAHAQRMPRERPPQNGVYATCIRQNELYSTADQSTPPIAEIVPGREMVVVDRNGKWLRVFANTDPPDTRQSDQPEFGNEAPPPISGWMLDQGIVTTNTVNGDLIVFGAADAAEDAASVPNPPPGMAEQARLLYRRVVLMFPQSRFVAEAMYRAADIRWQMQKEDAATLPSAHERAAYLRQLMDENEMKAVEKYFPGTRWADLAAFDLIDNKLCGDWQGYESCPEKETGYYLQYVHDHPDSPKAAEALYDALWRQASAGDMWSEDGNASRAQKDRDNAHGILAEMEQRFPDSSFTARAAEVVFKIDQGMAVYVGARE
jgi:outer membrane protein assembly factor BamD (BamD/ComL family)